MSRRWPGGFISATPSTSYSGMWTAQRQFIQVTLGKWVGLPLYAFTAATFTSGTATGRIGPDLATARAGLTGTGTDAWKTNTAFFNTSNGIQLWTVPADGTYRIEVWGAQGGGGGYTGGFGSRMRGDFNLLNGQVIKILVGQTGGASYGGGGGMTAVATNTNTPLIVAGGGNTTSPWSSILSHAVTTTSGLASSNGVNAGGTDGGGGIGGAALAGGAGFTGNGGASTCSGTVVPLSFINGGTGGQTCNSIGGFGGGAASDGCCSGASGGGGGYSGGGGGNTSSITGGAGGSFNSGSNQSNNNGNTGTATRVGNGQVIITKL